MAEHHHKGHHGHHEHTTVGVALGLKHSIQHLVGQKVLIQNFKGHFLGGEIQKDSHPKLVEKGQDWEHFVLEQRPNGKYAFKNSHSGFYLGGTKNVNDKPKLVEQCNAWEEFTLEPVGQSGDQFAIRNVDGNYLGGVENKDDRPHWKPKADGWEFWHIYPANFAAQAQVGTFATIGQPYASLFGRKVGIQNHKGYFLGGQKDKGAHPQWETKLQGWEYFTLEQRPNGKVAFKHVDSGLYLGKHVGLGEKPALTEKADAWEEFRLVPYEQGHHNTFAIQNVNGFFLGGVENPGDKPVWKDSAQGWEAFKIVFA